LLKKIGYKQENISIVANGLEVLKHLKSSPSLPDLILMDVNMPEMDGMEATKQIQEMYPDHRRPKIIALTANALSGDRERFLGMGMDGYLSKPLQQDKLFAALNPVEALKLNGSVDNDSNDTDELIDWDQLDMISDDFCPEFSAMYDDFVQSISKQLEQLYAEIRSKSPENAKNLAHQIKGVASSYGFSSFSLQLREIELDPMEKVSNSKPELEARLRDLWMASCREVEEQRAS
ncbi:MAG: response regulator, partial [Verrucomicrobiota bacterium]